MLTHTQDLAVLEKPERDLLRRVDGEERIFLSGEDQEVHAIADRLQQRGLLRSLRRRDGRGWVFVLSGVGLSLLNQLPYDS